MKPEIREIDEKKLIGMRVKTSLSDNKTSLLWQNFMSRFNEIEKKLNTGYYSVHVYDGLAVFNQFTEKTQFEKWAAVEVAVSNMVPEGFESCILSGGRYAVFIHKGPANTFHKTAQHIFGNWLPNSEFELDDREHFEIMGEKYKGPDNPESEEEVWVPVK